MVSKRHLKKALLYILTLCTLFLLYVMTKGNDVTNDVITLPTVTVPYSNLVVTFPVTAHNFKQKPLPALVIREPSNFIPGEELQKPKGEIVISVTLPSKEPVPATPGNTQATIPLPTPSSPMEASEQAEDLKQEKGKSGFVPDVVGKEEDVEEDDDVVGKEEDVEENYDVVGKEEDDVKDEEVYKPQFLVRSNGNMMFNDVLSEDVMPGYFDTTSDPVAQFEQHLQETQKNMEDRLSHIKEHCKVKTKYLKTHRNNLYYFPEHSMTWCPVYKAGSTNWEMFFCRQYLSGVYQLHVDNPEIKNVYCELNYFGAYQQKNWAPGAKDWAERSGKGLKFLTARHPYERLVSAYRNKFEDCRNQRFNNGHALKILRKYRTIDPSTSPEAKNKLLEAARAMCNTDVRVLDPANPYMVPMGATFKEFTQYIVDNFRNGDWPDYHWAPMTKECDLCLVEYDVIEKFETMERDHHYLLYKLGRPELLSLIAGSHTNPSGNTETDVIKYLDTLDEQLIWYLYAIYKDDFDLFGYKPHVRLRSNPNNTVL